MSDVTKRSIALDAKNDSKRQEVEAAIKPGRRPVNSEPKNKRTAQNRAAQRAFRERKERRMKELEMQVESLQSEKSHLNNESEFLRYQVETLIQELGKYRDSTSIRNILPPRKNSISEQSTVSPSTSERKSIPTDYTVPSDEEPQGEFNFKFAWNGGKKKSADKVPGLSDCATNSSASTKSSPTALEDTSTPGKEGYGGFEFDNHFDEPVDEFCNDLGQVCGTKSCPVPKERVPAAKWLEERTPFVEDENNFSKMAHDANPMSFLDSVPFDPVLAFGQDYNDYSAFDQLVPKDSTYDPLQFLTTEESVSDPIRQQQYQNVSPLELQKEQGFIKDEELDSMIVPSKDGDLMRCSEIWDRVTTHPRYSELDIDGLCAELKHKAKCSERGVVVDSKDVKKLLERAAKKQQDPVSQNNMFLKI